MAKIKDDDRVWVYKDLGGVYRWRPLSFWAYSGPHTAIEAQQICDRLNSGQQ